MDRSPHGVPEAEVKRWLRLYRERYGGFNVRHFYARMRREPRACFGEMLHIDGSRHRWLTLRPEEFQSLIVVVDDATKRVLYAQLGDSETTHAILTALAAVVRAHGIPQALYSDRASWATFTAKAGEPVDRTLQDRLVKELTAAGIRTLERANRYLADCFLSAFNDEFSRPAAHPESGFAALATADLQAIFCHEENRTVQRDNTVTLEGVRLQIVKQPGRVTCAGLSVIVRRHLDGTHTLRGVPNSWVATASRVGL